MRLRRKSGFVNHFIVSSEPLSGENVWLPLEEGDVVGVDFRMRVQKSKLGRVESAAGRPVSPKREETAPRERGETWRRALIEALAGPALTSRDLSALVRLSERDVLDHLEELGEDTSRPGQGARHRAGGMSCVRLRVREANPSASAQSLPGVQERTHCATSLSHRRGLKTQGLGASRILRPVHDPPAEAKAKVGQLLRGKWRLDRVLGMGGMGWVYAATHRNRSRVAIKFLLPELARDEEMKKRFLREGYVANTIGHPGVVMVHDDDIDEDGVAFLVMELLEGGTLYELRRAAGGKLPLPIVIGAMDGLLEVLARAHDKGVVHRDIKPANVFITRQGRVKVLDFGIARLTQGSVHTDEATGTGTLMGSIAYMPPEQASGDWAAVGARSDIWAVGATMFRLITGEHVHKAPGVAEMLELAITKPARPIGSVAPELPPSLCRVVDRALAFAAKDRWPDADSMLQVLREQVEGGAPRSSDRARELASFVDTLITVTSQPEPMELGPPSRQAVTVADQPRAKRPPLLAMSRHDALQRLESFGITGSDVYLIDTVPLLEMIWADGRVQAEELAILDGFLRSHIKNVNELFGADVITYEQAHRFVARFLGERPDPELFSLFRSIVPLVATDSESGVMSIARRRAMLDFCLDIGAACVAEYPQGDHERFCQEEKALFESIFRTLSPDQS